MTRSRIVAYAFAAFCIPRVMHGQEAATLSGRVVHKVTKVGVAGAEVSLTFRNARLITDSAGHFDFERLAAGAVTLIVRRLGFRPESLGVELPRADSVTIELAETAQELEPVNVTGREELLARGKLSGFYERKRYGMGRFLEEKDIEKFISRRLADILLARVPGIRIMRSRRSGSAAYVFSTRLGAGCYPDVYLDGAVVFSSASAKMPGISVESVLFDVNLIDAGHVAAVEYYAGPAQMPAQYNRTGSACGALLLWTK